MSNNFEKTSGLGVSNHYGPREIGGVEGVTCTGGVNNEFLIDFDNTDLEFGFPVTNGSAYVTIVDFTPSDGSTFTIGGVDVTGATDAAPVQIPADNTGVIVSDATSGQVLVTYNKYPL